MKPDCTYHLEGGWDIQMEETWPDNERRKRKQDSVAGF